VKPRVLPSRRDGNAWVSGKIITLGKVFSTDVMARYKTAVTVKKIRGGAATGLNRGSLSSMAGDGAKAGERSRTKRPL
jgi:hypothetical protein